MNRIGARINMLIGSIDLAQQILNESLGPVWPLGSSLRYIRNCLGNIPILYDQFHVPLSSSDKDLIDELGSKLEIRATIIDDAIDNEVEFDDEEWEDIASEIGDPLIEVKGKLNRLFYKLD